MASAHAADEDTLAASMHAHAARSRVSRRTIQPTHIDDEEQRTSGSSGERKSAAHESAVPSDCIDLTDETEEQSSTSAQPPQQHQSARAALIGTAHARAAKRKHVEHSAGDDDDDEHSASAPSGVAVPARSAAPRRTASRLAASHGVPLLQRKARGPVAAADGDDVSDESDDEEWEERKRPSTKRRGRPPANANAAAGASSTATAAAAVAAAPSRPAAPSPSPLPFIFNPAHLPDAATRAASDRAVQQRFQSWLAGSVPVGKTTSQQRNRMPKDLLLQRNLEIQG